jgi:hypothetical protein
MALLQQESEQIGRIHLAEAISYRMTTDRMNEPA